MNRRDLLLSLDEALREGSEGTSFGSGAWARAVDVSHRQALRELSQCGEAAFRRDHFEPGHFTASAFVLSPDESQLLLIRHAKLGMWLQPGGHVDAEDTDLTATALRELREETSLTEVTLLERYFDVDVHVIPAYGTQPVHRHHDVRVLLRAQQTAVLHGDDALEAAWFPLSSLAVQTGPLRDGLGTDDSVRRVARHLLDIRR